MGGAIENSVKLSATKSAGLHIVTATVVATNKNSAVRQPVLRAVPKTVVCET